MIKDCIRGIVLLKLTADRHEISHGLAETAELFVYYYLHYVGHMLNCQPYEGRLPLTSWWRISSNVTVGQSSLISLAHHEAIVARFATS